MKKENKKKVIIPAVVLLSAGLMTGCGLFGGSNKAKDNDKSNNKPSVVSDKLSSNLDYNSVEESNINSNEKKNDDKKDKKEDNKKTKKAENKDNKTVDSIVNESIVNENKKVARANSNNGTISGIVNTKKTDNNGNSYYKPSKPVNPSKQVTPSKPVTPNKPSKPVNSSKPSQGGTVKPVEPEKPAKPNKPVTPDKPVTPNKPNKPEVKLVKSEVESKSEKRDYKDFSYTIKEDNTLEKGKERIEKEGIKGYTVYTMKRNKDTYSDGTIKYSDWTIENKQVINPVNGVKVVGTKEDKPVTPNKPDNPEKPVTPDNPSKPDQPKVTVVSTEEESKTEDKDFVDFTYDEFEDQNMPKGETKVIEEGKKGYTTYTYTRTKTVYSDGTIKYSDWLEAGKKVVAPVNGTKFIGTHEERKLGWQKDAAIKVGQDLIAFRASLGLTTNIHYDQTYAKMMADNDTFGHYGDYNEVVAYMPTEFDENGSNVVEMWKNSTGHKRQISYGSEDGYGSDWYIGVVNNGTNVYYSAYSVSKESQPIFDRYQKEHTKDTPDFPEEENPTPEPEKPVETPTETKEESNKEEQPSTIAEPVVEETKPVEEVKEVPKKVEETTEKEVKEVKENQQGENKVEETNKVKEAK